MRTKTGAGLAALAVVAVLNTAAAKDATLSEETVQSRIRAVGTLFDKFDLRIMPDLAGTTPTLRDAWLNWKINPHFQVLAGKRKLPVGLERETEKSGQFCRAKGVGCLAGGGARQ